MSSRKQIGLALASAVLCGGLITHRVAGALQSAPQEKPETSKPAAKNAALLKDYSRWQRVTAEPVQMDAVSATLCAAPSPPQVVEIQKKNPHFAKFITVYVNKTGQDAMLQQATPYFPVGTVIVKEKRAAPDDKTPELMTVMTKKPRGYDLQRGDWEYMVVEGASHKIQARGKLENCQNCHVKQKSIDYVFRNYLPDATRAKLR